MKTIIADGDGAQRRGYRFSVIAALLICACSATQEPFPTNTENQKRWKQQYTAGEISWSEYQMKLKTEKK